MTKGERQRRRNIEALVDVVNAANALLYAWENADYWHVILKGEIDDCHWEQEALVRALGRLERTVPGMGKKRRAE